MASPTGLIGSARSRPGNVQPGGDLPAPSAVPWGDFVPVDRLADYWISVWSFMRRRVAGTGHIYLAEYDASGGLLALTEFATISAVEARRTRHAIHMGPNEQLGRLAWQADTVKVKVVAWANGTPDMTWDVDSWQIERGKHLTAYAPRPQELVDFQVDRTQIADDAITTPKLVVNAVVAEKIAAEQIGTEHFQATATIRLVTNAGATVIIDEDGLAVIQGKIEVRNPGGTVIIDGTSDMFRIAATGTLSIASGPTPAGGYMIETFVDLSLGLPYAPSIQTYNEVNNTTAVPMPYVDWNPATGLMTRLIRASSKVVPTNVSRVILSWQAAADESANFTDMRYYVMEQAAI